MSSGHDRAASVPSGAPPVGAGGAAPSSSSPNPNRLEAGHYVVTAHRPGSVLSSVRCSFLGSDTTDVVIVKSRRLEVRQLSSPDSPPPAGGGGDVPPQPSFPLVLSLPINGRITALLPLRPPRASSDYLFLTTERKRYAVISYAPGNSPHPVITHASGSLADYGCSVLGREAECGPIAAAEPNGRCVALHLYDGFITILPLNLGYDPRRAEAGRGGSHHPGKKRPAKRSGAGGGGGLPLVGPPYNARIDERTVLGMAFLPHTRAGTMPQLALLHQDSRHHQHVVAHSVDLHRKTLVSHSDPHTPGGGGRSGPSGGTGAGQLEPPPQGDRLRKSRVDGHSGIIVGVPPWGWDGRPTAPGRRAAAAAPSSGGLDRKPPAGGPSASVGGGGRMGGVLVLGQRQVTYHSTSEGVTKVLPIGGDVILLSCERVPAGDGDGGAVRYLLGDERGRVHLLALTHHPRTGVVAGMHLDTLGVTSAPTSLCYLRGGLLFVGSQFGESQLVRILDEPVPVSGGGGEESDGDAVMAGTTYLSVVEEYTNLGPVVDFDLLPSAGGGAGGGGGGAGVGAGGAPQPSDRDRPPGSHAHSHSPPRGSRGQSMVVTASGTGRDGTVRLVRNGIGMSEYASVGLGGIKGMWNLRSTFGDGDDAFLVQSYVGETRVLGVVSGEEESDEEEEEGGSEEVSMEEEEDGGSRGAGSEEEEEEGGGGTLEEVQIPGFDSGRSTLYAGNVDVGGTSSSSSSSLAVQITDAEVRLVDLSAGACVHAWRPSAAGDGQSDDAEDEHEHEHGGGGGHAITVASANGSGQIVVALRGGALIYLTVVAPDGGGGGGARIEPVGRTTLDREISCLDLRPFDDGAAANAGTPAGDDGMEVDAPARPRAGAGRSDLVAVGLWDDFTVRLLSLSPASGDGRGPLSEALRINLGADDDDDGDGGGADSGDAGGGGGRPGQHMMARSVCLVRLDSSSSSSSGGARSLSPSGGGGGSRADMLLVGLGDGGLVSFTVSRGSGEGGGPSWFVWSRKEVSLGTRGIGLVPFRSDAGDGGTCVLATGDRPTVVYLTGGGGGGGSGGGVNPKLCYSNVNLSSDPGTEGGDEARRQERQKGAGRQNLSVNVATPFHSSLLFSASSSAAAAAASSSPPADSVGGGGGGKKKCYSLCVSDESTLRLGVIDDIQKLHVTTHRLGMAPRRVAHHEAGRVIAVGCIDDGSGRNNAQVGAESNMGNCVRFFDDATFEEVDRLDLDPYEMILSMVSCRLREVDDPPSGGCGMDAGEGKSEDGGAGSPPPDRACRPYLLVGTAYAYPDEDEPTSGRILVLRWAGGGGDCGAGGDVPAAALSRSARAVTEMQTRGGVYSICPFYGGTVLVSVNSKTHLCRLTGAGSADGGDGVPELKFVGAGHHGHILSLFVRSLVPPCGDCDGGGGGGNPSSRADVAAAAHRRGADEERPQLAIVGDLMRSISVVRYYPRHQTLEEEARDYNANWTTAIEMLSEDVYLGGENWNNLFVLRRNANAASEEVRCRLDTVGEFHLGEMPNKFMGGSLVMPSGGSGGVGGGGGDRSGGGGAGAGAVHGPPSSPQKAGKGGSTSIHRPRKASVAIGSQTLFATVDGTIGSVLGLDANAVAFFSALERAMARSVRPVGDLGHHEFRAFEAERRVHPSHGFVDGDLVESFLDLDRAVMERVVRAMNEDGRWEIEDLDGVAGGVGADDGAVDGNADEVGPGGSSSVLTAEDVLAMVEEISMLH